MASKRRVAYVYGYTVALRGFEAKSVALQLA
jgi:hypothetical protein